MNHRFDYDSRICSAQRALELIGDKWTLLILRESFLGITRFSDFHRALGCARNILSARLTRLVQHGILETREYREEGERAREAYHLTAKGRDLFATVVALMDWGDRYLSPDGAPIEVRHRDCKARVHVEAVCSKGHRHLTAADTYPKPGPGARKIA